MKEKILEILRRYDQPMSDPFYSGIEAEELVKLFVLHDVSQRSELLKAFYAYIDDKWALGMLTDKVDEVIEGFEKSL